MKAVLSALNNVTKELDASTNGVNGANGVELNGA